MTFNSTILNVPGLGGSGPQHWQSLWEKEYGFTRINQIDWETPVCADWTATIETAIRKHNPAGVILVAHSLACVSVAHWVQKYNTMIKAALLVAPADTEAPSYPEGTSGFSPMPLFKFPFPTIVVASTNDFYVTYERAELFAESWGSQFINVGEAGHINVNSGFGNWDAGLEILKRLD